MDSCENSRADSEPSDHGTSGQTAQVASEIRNYILKVLGIGETRWTGSGQRKLATEELLLYSGHEEDNAPHTTSPSLMKKFKRRDGWSTLKCTDL